MMMIAKLSYPGDDNALSQNVRTYKCVLAVARTERAEDRPAAEKSGLPSQAQNPHVREQM